MYDGSQPAGRTSAPAGFCARKAWLGGLLIVLGVVLIAAGFVVRSQPAWMVSPALSAYNKGVDVYHLPPGLLPASDERPAEWPVERARAYWEQAAADDKDRKLQALALYNLGTFLAREAWASSLAFGLLDSPRVDMSEPILRLREAVRLDPGNESAKYNLEVLDRVATSEGEKMGGPGPGYSAGDIEKGF